MAPRPPFCCRCARLVLFGSIASTGCATTSIRHLPYPDSVDSTTMAAETAAGPVEPPSDMATAGASVTAPLLAEERARTHFDFSVRFSDTELDDIDFDAGGFPTVTGSVPRERTTLRFGFGSPGVRGYFDIFGEEFGDAELVDVVGIGGGMEGAPAVGGSTVLFVVPYGWDLGIAYGEDDIAGNDFELFYAEWRGRLGGGIEWKGLRPSAGVALSALAGTIDPDSGSDIDMDGFHVGIYLEIRYRHPSFPLYGLLRSYSGDIEGEEFGIGFEF